MGFNHGESGSLSRATSAMPAAAWHNFHETGTFLGIWLVAALLAPNVLMKLRPLLMPLAWAFFMMMILLPLTDLIEQLLHWIAGQALRLAGLPPCQRWCACLQKRTTPRRSHRGTTVTAIETPGSSEAEDDTGAVSSDGSDVPEAEWSRRSTPTQSHNVLEEENGLDEDEHCGIARFAAVFIVMLIFAGSFAGFGFAIYESALHMQDNWDHYQNGGQKLQQHLDNMLKGIPKDFVAAAVGKVESSMNEVLGVIVSASLETLGSTLAEVAMMLLYMMFWLCNPMYIGNKVSRLFKRYIMLKGLASLMYAFCVWVVLKWLTIDLSTILGIITFLFNFVPEVGPFMAMMLPVPIILFDDRLERPFNVLAWALVLQLSLKFVFGNIVEVLLVEAQEDMHMHPVIILFAMVFFGWIWGATGMVLSVPIMAVVKASIHDVPSSYRDPILILLEGDQRAPLKWRLRRDASMDAGDGTTR